jgi:hypothetical protein
LGSGVVVAWGILKQPVEEESKVVIRIVATDPDYSHLAAEGVDPFSGARRPVGPGPAAPIVLSQPATVELWVRRGDFADHPRLEIHLYGRAAPVLTVYYLGVPDTTPEFVSEALLDAYLDDAAARARTSGRPTP